MSDGTVAESLVIIINLCITVDYIRFEFFVNTCVMCELYFHLLSDLEDGFLFIFFLSVEPTMSRRRGQKKNSVTT